MTTIDIGEAATQLPQLIDRALAGEDIAFARGGLPVAQISPITPRPLNREPRELGQLEGKMWTSPDFDAPLPEEIARAFGMLDERGSRSTVCHHCMASLLFGGIGMQVVKIDTRRITDSETFHDLFAASFGFPDFYGRNMNAWIDCMTCLDDPSAGMSKVHAPPGSVVVLELEHVTDLMRRCPEQYEAIVECASFVNCRRIEKGDPPVLSLSFHMEPL